MEHIEVAVKYSDYRRIPLFIEAVADWYVENLDEESKEYLRENPAIGVHWDTLCLHIRNEFLYPQKYVIKQEMEEREESGQDSSTLFIDSIFTDDLFCNADEYSAKIFERIIEKLHN